ncbi:hypothetical protein COAQ111491_11690 [Comamonas aquatilis]
MKVQVVRSPGLAEMTLLQVLAGAMIKKEESHLVQLIGLPRFHAAGPQGFSSGH